MSENNKNNKKGNNSSGLTIGTCIGIAIGTAVGVGMIGILMGITGYDGSLDVQPDSANTMIILLTGATHTGKTLLEEGLLNKYHCPYNPASCENNIMITQ